MKLTRVILFVFLFQVSGYADFIKIKNITEPGFAVVYCDEDPIDCGSFENDDDEVCLTMWRFSGIKKNKIKTLIVNGNASVSYEKNSDSKGILDLGNLSTVAPRKEEIDTYIKKIHDAVKSKNGKLFSKLYLSKSNSGINPNKIINDGKYYSEFIVEAFSKSKIKIEIEKIRCFNGVKFSMLTGEFHELRINIDGQSSNLQPIFIAKDKKTNEIIVL